MTFLHNTLKPIRTTTNISRTKQTRPTYKLTHTHNFIHIYTQVDLALSFQDNAGCLDIWRQITQVQSRATDCVHTKSTSVAEIAHAVAVAHHASLHRQQQHTMWVNANTEARQLEDDGDDDDDIFRDQDAEAVAVSMAAAAAAAAYQQTQYPELPQPPTLHNLEEVANLIAQAQAMPQREALAMYISQNNCGYLQLLLTLFPSAESRQDYERLATLAACIKTILLLNDPCIIDFIVGEETVYEQICSTLEYDPDLRDQANHRWFLRERCKFRTVVWMDDAELVATIHRSFRVSYLRDTLLRPTMDESSLSTLSSLQAFTHADVVKGVTCPMQEGGDSYLIKVIRMLGVEIREISVMEWCALEEGSLPQRPPSPAIVATTRSLTWQQHLCPQDESLESRKLRQRGCISFFRELFNMVRISLQQSDKDDFYAAIVGMEVEVQQFPDIEQQQRSMVNLLSLLGSVLSDPCVDVTEKAAVLEIIGGIAMHDPSHIRRHCLEYHEIWKRSPRIEGELTGPVKPHPNDSHQVLFRMPPNDLLASLLYLMAAETDAGVLLQTSEIIRIILDTDILGEQTLMGGFSLDEIESLSGVNAPVVEDRINGTASTHGSTEGGSEQNQFLSLFYEHYIHWIVAPFQYTILHPARRFPESIMLDPSQSRLLQSLIDNFKRGAKKDEVLLPVVTPCVTRGSFAIELLTFCVRAHLYRMKFFLLRSRVLGSVLKLLAPTAPASSGDRCLKLASLRFLRSILSVKDEFYNRHIIQHNLFAPVFDAFRANPVGDNLVSSAIIEMCDFIQGQNVTSLIEYIVTKHLSASAPNQKSLEEVATPYVDTLTILRKKYEDNLSAATEISAGDPRNDDNKDTSNTDTSSIGSARYFSTMGGRPMELMSEKALEDQRKFRQTGSEESYFEDDEDEVNNKPSLRPPSPIPISADVAISNFIESTSLIYKSAGLNENCGRSEKEDPINATRPEVFPAVSPDESRGRSSVHGEQTL